MKLNVIRTKKAVVAVETPSGKYKLFQILFRPDGSILVPFPYFAHSSAQLAEGTLKAGQTYPVNYTVKGKVTLHRVKYTHHSDGEAHFSQDGKILTRIRKRANPLHTHIGHLFTVQLQGLSDFQRVQDRDLRANDRKIVCASFGSEPASLKLLAYLYAGPDFLRRTKLRSDAGPWVATAKDGKLLLSILFALDDSANRVLALTFEEIPSTFPNQPSGLSFIGGFDAPEIALDHKRDTTFLVLLSPAGLDPSLAAAEFGSVDL